MGPKRHGRVLMCGSGVGPSDVWDNIPSCTMQQRIIGKQTDKIARLEGQAKEAAEMLKEQGRLLAEIHATIPHNDNQSPIYISPSLGSNEVVCKSTNQGSPLRVNATVSILSLRDPTKVFATARITSMDPDHVSSLHPLG